ncbi:MAG: helix-turn-helix transcriptional regulator [Helicobacteraceae bacterium]|nr:helix-turn-helix transcriptional regulator [Helicobacteraceae bacterium]
MSENIIKAACKELGVTQKELAERIGVTQETISVSAKDEPSRQVRRAVELLLENHALKQENTAIAEMGAAIRKILQTSENLNKK